MAPTAAGSRLRQPLSAVNSSPNVTPDRYGSDEFSCRDDEKKRGKNKMDYKGKSEQMFECIKKLAGSRLRQPISAVNSSPNVTPDRYGSDGGGTIEFSCRDDVERLLNQKMLVKKIDYKGKSEQMCEYIKKLRACIKWYMELEDGYLVEQDKISAAAESEEKRHFEIELEMRKKIEERDLRISELERQYGELKGRFEMEEAAKLAMTRSCEEEREAKVAAENSRVALSVELERTSEEVRRASDHIRMLQETNRRLQEYNTSLQQYNSNLQADVLQHGETISKLQNDKNVIMESLANLRSTNSSMENQLNTYQSSQQEAVKQTEELNQEVCHLRSELSQVRENCHHHLSQVESLTAEVASYKDLSGKSAKDLNIITTEHRALEETCASRGEQIQTLSYQLTAANEKLKCADLTTSQTINECEDQKKLVKDLQIRVEEAELQLLEAEKLRKKLHNTILELKGKIRVFCRVRPILSDYDCNSTEGAIVSFPTSTEVLGRGIDLMHNAQNHSFTFDKVFSHAASQEDVFVEISQLVQSALDGYKVCIFAYGQTGSGKTYTMMGKPEATEQKGLIPRSLEQIFQISQTLQTQGWKYKMQASMLEIYNETIRDLLSPGRPGSMEANAALGKQYTIKHDSNGNTHVSDLNIIDVCSIKEVSFLLQQAAHSRSVGKTQMNEQSSRSHFVFTLRISGVNKNTEQQVQGVLNLIDLAGSERLKLSGSTGERLKETQAINKSLSALSDVIVAIAKKEDHVPFRNSKLTYLLQPSLGGDSKTLMFVNVSPESSSAGESICSLRFAARVNSCEIGVPRRHAQGRSTDSRLS